MPITASYTACGHIASPHSAGIRYYMLAELYSSGMRLLLCCCLLLHTAIKPDYQLRSRNQELHDCVAACNQCMYRLVRHCTTSAPPVRTWMQRQALPPAPQLQQMCSPACAVSGTCCAALAALTAAVWGQSAAEWQPAAGCVDTGELPSCDCPTAMLWRHQQAHQCGALAM